MQSDNSIPQCFKTLTPKNFFKTICDLQCFKKRMLAGKKYFLYPSLSIRLQDYFSTILICKSLEGYFRIHRKKSFDRKRVV